ncbi:BadF/BadG/BcrA/BcrD ATPase family protein [Mesonia maritima]|uniref:BadF/BadG/BcrA/BcrD ATPase family protein n=1 Tax=Mesonia maritima TaxID=1793873 RepID=UPI0036372C76
MLLIADGGSTKCDWILLDEEKQVLEKTQTKGLNPSVFSLETLEERLCSNEILKKYAEKIQQVDFYGAGCGTPLPKEKLRKVLHSFYKKSQVNVFEDTVAAVRAVTHEPGIVCILGTGSNACYFDGKEVNVPIASLGYVLMDEASGNYFGKKLIQDYYYHKMPKKIAEEFEKKFNLDPDEIKSNLYQKENPNAYLASFASFIFTNSQLSDYFYNLILEGIQLFIENRVLTITESKKVPVHFVGSIAHFSSEIIADCLKTHNLAVGKIIQHPIEELTNYYRTNGI